MACALRFSLEPALHAGCVVSVEKGAKAVVVEDARHAWNAARILEAAETQTQIEKMIAMAIGNAFCDTTLFTGSRF